MTGGPVATARDVGKVYHLGAGRTLEALHGIDLDIAAGTLVALTGPSGSGKSTLLRLVGLLDLPSRGRIDLFGRPTGGLPQAVLTGIRRHRLGFIPQEAAFIDHWPVWQNVACSLLPQGVPASVRRRRAMDRLEAVGLAARSSSLPSQLSGGERQRAAIARALLPGPALILADEPTSSLDPKTRDLVIGLLEGMARGGAAVIAATNDDHLIGRADAIVELAAGARLGVRSGAPR